MSLRPRQLTQISQGRVNQVITSIQDHRTGPLPIGQRARRAHFSPSIRDQKNKASSEHQASEFSRKKLGQH